MATRASPELSGGSYCTPRVLLRMNLTMEELVLEVCGQTHRPKRPSHKGTCARCISGAAKPTHLRPRIGRRGRGDAFAGGID
eukprot:2370560-Alexandrium_andersonii.AAC.1